jgi:cyclohexa-1,5-dienecarbonyl-CoA hydratase
MAEEKTVRLEIADQVARITFDRPRHNVFNIDMIEAFNAILSELVEDKEIKCVAIFGAGPSWCAGVDVGDHKPDMVDRMITTFNRSFEIIDTIEVPLIAAVHGACVGGGMEYAIACDVVIASEKAVFGQPEVRLGFLPPYAAIRLPELIGPAKAIEVCTSGRVYPAAEARAMGFVSTVTAADAFEKTVEKRIGELKVSSPLILRLNKRAVKQHYRMPLAQALPSVGDLFLNKLMKTGDTAEGIASFYEKRKPQWKNR